MFKTNMTSLTYRFKEALSFQLHNHRISEDLDILNVLC